MQQIANCEFHVSRGAVAFSIGNRTGGRSFSSHSSGRIGILGSTLHQKQDRYNKPISIICVRVCWQPCGGYVCMCGTNTWYSCSRMCSVKSLHTNNTRTTPKMDHRFSHELVDYYILVLLLNIATNCLLRDVSYVSLVWCAARSASPTSGMFAKIR